MFANTVRRALQEGRPAFGTYITSSSVAMVEVAAQAGLDFVRLDAYHAMKNPETLEGMVHAALMMRITPWVRVPNEPNTIANVLDMGALAITVPNIGTVAEARRAIRSAKYPPHGEREHSRPGFARAMAMPDYLRWCDEELMLGCQIEGMAGLENFREIIQIPEIDVIQSGRGDLSMALGVPGETFHPVVLSAEERIVAAALAAGKAVSLMCPLSVEGLEYMRHWMERGVQIPVLESGEQVLLRGYQEGMAKLRRNRTKEEIEPRAG